VYLGPQKNVVPYFKNLGYEFNPLQNPADVLMDILSGQGLNKKSNFTSADLVAKWEEFSKQGPEGLAKLKQVTLDDESEPIEEDKDEKHLALDIGENNSLPNQVNNLRTRGSKVISRKVDIEPYTSQQLLALKSVRTTSNFFYQSWICHNRSLIQQYRLLSSLVLEVGVAFLAGTLMGLACMGSDGEMFRGMYVVPMTLVSPGPTGWIIPLLGLLIVLLFFSF
jgi:hypothetical protein